MTCSTCQGQGLPVSGSIDNGNPGDVTLCKSCEVLFNFYVKAESKCYTACNAGYYTNIIN